MPWFLIGPWVVPVAFAALALWALLRKLKGKKLAVLGEQGVGKTCLIHFLTTGSIPRKYEPDSFARKVRGRRFKLRDLKLNIPSLKHLPGSADDYAQWEEVTNEADIVLYLFRTDRLMKEHKPTEARVRKDMGQIKRWLQKKQKKQKGFPLFLIGTHCDLTNPDFTTLSPDKRSIYKNKVREMPMFQKMVLLGGSTRKVRFVPGSLKSSITTEQLVYDLYGEIRELVKEKS